MMATILPFRDAIPTIDSSTYLAETATIIGDVELGADSSVWFGSVLRGDVMRIRIGARTNIQDNSVIHVTTDRYSTTVGDSVTVGHRALLHGCTIGDHSLIGMGAIVMDGAIVGERCIVGAGSLVTQRTVIPPGHLAVGSPAVVKRKLTSREVNDIQFSAAHYVELAAIYIAGQSS